MTGIAKERSRGSRLDDAAEIHDGDMIADVPHDPQVVRDEQIGKTTFSLNVFQQVDHLGLDRNVEGGDRLVGDDQLGVESEGTGDGKALSLPTGKLRRAIAKLIGPQARRGETTPRPDHRCADAASVPWTRIGSATASAGPHAWVERAVGILEDHLHAAAQGTQLRLRRVRDVDAVEPDLAGVGFDQANDHPAERRLPAAALADDAERLARPQAQRRVLDGEYGGKRAPRAALLRKALRRPTASRRGGASLMAPQPDSETNRLRGDAERSRQASGDVAGTVRLRPRTARRKGAPLGERP